MIAIIGSPAYRRDIDGLRAIAVLGVILFHAGVPFLPGGFLGVDIFFVISGYLITRILQADLARGGIDFLHFYERRLRRILPALVVVVAACVPMALWLLLPDALDSFGEEAFATMVFANNLKLAGSDAYWDIGNAQKPLLHTWSLGVEEQFYLTFPVLLMLAARWSGRGQLGAIAVVGLLSFTVSQVGAWSFPDQNFYLPTSRAWELMVGCAVAYIPRRPRRFDGPSSVVAILAIGASFAFLSEAPTPSVWSLPVVAAAAVLILCGREGNWAFRILAARLMAGIGLISYSLYLWHQPVFAFARATSTEDLGAATLAALIGLVFVLSLVTWRFVERPARDRGRVSLRWFVGLIVIPAALLGGFGLLANRAEGWPSRMFPPGYETREASAAYNRRIRTFGERPFVDTRQANVLIVGNSFARDAANVLIEAGALKGKEVRYQEVSGPCPIPRAGATLGQADVVVIALVDESAACFDRDLRGMDRKLGTTVVFVGSKFFGPSLNPLGRVPLAARGKVLLNAGERLAGEYDRIARSIVPGRYVNLMRALGPDGRRVRFFDDAGHQLTYDGHHLTRRGAAWAAVQLRKQQSEGLATIAAANPRGPTPAR